MSASSKKTAFLCGINPKAGKDERVLGLVKEAFGAETLITLLEEESDIYAITGWEESVLDKLRDLQADPDVIDTQIEVMRTWYSHENEKKIDFVYLVLADVEAGAVKPYMDALQAETDKVGAGGIELLYMGEIFSQRADVAAIVGANRYCMSEVVEKVRSLPGVVDTHVYILKASAAS